MNTPTCRRCGRPCDIHCPGCSTCDPDFTCPPTCDGTAEQVAAAAAAVERWDDAHATPVTTTNGAAR